ncbi:MAG: chorismate mutase [Pseudomonadota bacterium]
MITTRFFKSWKFLCLSFLSLMFASNKVVSLDTPLTTPFTLLISSVAQRLTFADQVALYKWNNAQSIADPQREQQVLSHTVQQAASYHLSSDYVSRFFSDQIEANKLVQYVLFANWHRFGNLPVAPASDLKRNIRTKLDQLQTILLQQLELSSPARHQQNCAKVLAEATELYATQHSLDALHRIALERALVNVCEPSS